MRNFADTKKCKHCKADPSLKLPVAKSDKQSNAGEFARSPLRLAWALAVLLVALVGVAFFHLRQSPLVTAELVNETVVAETAVTADVKRPEQNAVDEDPQSEATATQIVTDLKHFQRITESGIDYNEYDKKLESLKTNLNDALPSFVRHQPNDDTFRQEVSAALRDYTAAGNWWKTTITNSAVFNEADRTDRTQRNFESAQTHLTNAEKMLAR